MKKIIADTNAFLRIFLDDLPKQRKQFEAVLQKAKEKQLLIYVLQIVIFEIEFVLRKIYLVPKEKIIENLQRFIAISYLEIESRELFITALYLYNRKKISFVDCFIIAKAEAEKAEIFTFDKNLKKMVSKG